MHCYSRLSSPGSLQVASGHFRSLQVTSGRLRLLLFLPKSDLRLAKKRPPARCFCRRPNTINDGFVPLLLLPNHGTKSIMHAIRQEVNQFLMLDCGLALLGEDQWQTARDAAAQADAMEDEDEETITNQDLLDEVEQRMYQQSAAMEQKMATMMQQMMQQMQQMMPQQQQGPVGPPPVPDGAHSSF